MKEMVICKSCSYVMEKGKLRDVCPACGVKAAMFQPHDERISPRRKFLLSLDLHPVLVHFPVAFSATLLILSFVAVFTQGAAGSAVRGTIQILGLALPVAVLAAVGAGIFDGKIRFRRVTTPILRTKIVLGHLYFALSLAIAVLVRNAGDASNTVLFITGGLCGACIVLATLLGLLGTPLLRARFPG